MADNPFKRCACCKQELPRSAFPVKRANRDGLYSYCRKCNVEKIKQYQKSRPDWREYKKNYDKQRSDKIRDKISARGKEWYEQNRERAIERARKWRLKNPEARRAISKNYKHKRRSIESSGITGGELFAWTDKQQKVCYWCGTKCAKSFHIDHYVPLARGGLHELSNLVISCRSCNLRKNAKDPLDFAREIGRLL